jgi:hypothetical protein
MTQWIEHQRDLLLDDEMREIWELQQRIEELKMKKAKVGRAA